MPGDDNRTGRRSHLNDFKRGGDGKYSYKGKLYAFDGEEAERKRYILKILIFSAASFAASAVPELFPPVKLPGDVFNFSVIPWIAQIIASLTVLWAAVKLYSGGEPLREYIYLRTVKALPGRLLVCVICAILTAGAYATLYLLYGVGGSNALNAAVRPIGSLLCAVIASGVYRSTLKEHWHYAEGLTDKAERSAK